MTQPAEDTLVPLGRFLYALLKGDTRLHLLHEELAVAPRLLRDIARRCFPDTSDSDSDLVTLVDLAVHAQPNSNSLSLLPARYHLFARALEGAFVCLNASSHDNNLPYFSLSHFERCPQCNGWVFELAICNQCGGTYIVGRDDLTETTNDHIAQPFRQISDDPTPEISVAYYLLDQQGDESIDEDEAIIFGENDDEHKTKPNFVLCVLCGGLAQQDRFRCECGDPSALRIVCCLKMKQQQPGPCLSCGSRRSTIYRFMTGKDAPVSVLATALY